jgi:hypothetical protein
MTSVGVPYSVFEAGLSVVGWDHVCRLHVHLGVGRRVADMVVEWVLLLSCHKGNNEKGERGERRAGTGRPTRTRHGGSYVDGVGSLAKAARARVMEHQWEVMRMEQERKNARGSDFGLDINLRGLPQLSVRRKLGVSPGPRQPARRLNCFPTRSPVSLVLAPTFAPLCRYPRRYRQDGQMMDFMAVLAIVVVELDIACL